MITKIAEELNKKQLTRKDYLLPTTANGAMVGGALGAAANVLPFNRKANPLHSAKKIASGVGLGGVAGASTGILASPFVGSGIKGLDVVGDKVNPTDKISNSTVGAGIVGGALGGIIGSKAKSALPLKKKVGIGIGAGALGLGAATSKLNHDAIKGKNRREEKLVKREELKQLQGQLEKMASDLKAMTNEELKEKSKQNQIIGIGSGLATIGGHHLLSDRQGKITGLTRNFHRTKTENVDGILNKGILASKSNDRETMSDISRGANIDQLEGSKNKTYLAKNKATDKGTKMAFLLHNGGLAPETKRLNVNIPYEDFRTGVVKTTKNPELRGLSPKELTRVIGVQGTHGRMMSNEEALNIHSKMSLKEKLTSPNYLLARTQKGAMKNLDVNTHTIEGDVDAKYIKGSPTYQKYGINDFKRYVKNNPKRFAGGVAKGVAGVGALGGGGLAYVNSYLDGKAVNQELTARDFAERKRLYDERMKNEGGQ